MSGKPIILFAALLLAGGTPAAEGVAALSGKVGVFSHYLFDGAGAARIGEFDVAGVVRQLVAMKADYFGLTLGQNTGWMCSPNATYERICGYAPGERCTVRDLPAELIPALKPHGIRLMLYLPCQPPFRDDRAVAAFGLAAEPRNTNRVLTPECVGKWASVIGEWSVRYGKDVFAWWFDGGYPSIGMDDKVAAVYAAAAKKGNPEALVSFNEGVKHPVRPWTDVADYMPGEIDEPLLECCAAPYRNGRLWHVMTFLGPGWGARRTRYSDAAWIRWLRAVTGNGGAVTIDLGREKPSGLFHPDVVAQMTRVMSAVRAGRGCPDASRDLRERPAPNRRSAPQLALRADGEVRCYGEEPDGRPVFLSSDDYGRTWRTCLATGEDPGAVQLSEWIRWGAWGADRRPNAQARFALLGGERLRSARWDNKDDVERYAFKDVGPGPVSVLQCLKPAGCTTLAALVAGPDGVSALVSKDDAESWTAVRVSGMARFGALYECADGSFVVLPDAGTGRLSAVRSADRGKSWRADGTVCAALASGAVPSFLRLSDGLLFATVNDPLRRNVYRCSRSPDDGRTWTEIRTIRLGTVAEDAAPDQTDAVELPDGRVLLALGPKDCRKTVCLDKIR